MKAKKTTNTPEPESAIVREEPRQWTMTPEEEAMVRTQVYLTRKEHEFLTREAAIENSSMAAVIRRIVDDRMEVPDAAWAGNPLLEPTPDDPSWEGHEDGARNHDHYISGAPKAFRKVRGKWVEQPLLAE